MHCFLWTLSDYFFYFLLKKLGGKRFAIIGLTIYHVNQEILRQCSRVAGNAVESFLMTASLSYYFDIKPIVFDSNLNKMTALITVCFISRSSSLVSWIPLALVKILEDKRFFKPIVVAGLTVALPLICISVLVDSYFYGVLCVPQYNFVVFNVVENVSAYFGKEPVYYYFKFLPDLLNEPFYKYGLFGFCLMQVR